jgi:hypothetical protein
MNSMLQRLFAPVIASVGTREYTIGMRRPLTFLKPHLAIFDLSRAAAIDRSGGSPSAGATWSMSSDCDERASAGYRQAWRSDISVACIAASTPVRRFWGVTTVVQEILHDLQN